jgi:hypothetical protein
MGIAAREADVGMAEERAGSEVLEELLTQVKVASAQGKLVGLGDAAAACFPDAEREEAVRQLSELVAQDSAFSLIGEGEHIYLYATDVMTEAYAQLAYGALHQDARAQIASVVRKDSEVYPRPTPLTVFECEPFALSSEEIRAAVLALAEDSQYADIRTTVASNGDVYLYSSAHLVPALAESLAEWASVGQADSP